MAPVPKPEGEADKGPASNDGFNGVDDINPPQFIINDADSNDSDSTDEEMAEGGYNEYQMLPQDADEDEENEMESEPNNINHEHLGNETLPSGTNSTHEAQGSSMQDSATRSSSLLDHSSLFQHTTGSSDRLPQYMQVPNLPKSDPKDLLWNMQRPLCSAEMDEDHANKVKAVMSNITLSQINIPDWAKDISDEERREKLHALKSNKDPPS